MTRSSVRLSLLLLCLAASGYAAFLTWSSEQQSRQVIASSRQFDSAARTAAVAVADLRGAQQAYVAVGQGQDFWFARVSAIAKDLTDNLAYMKALATEPAATAALDAANASLQDFLQMDRRAREYARSRQLSAASDLIFADGFDLTRKAGEAVERAATAELTANDGAAGSLRRGQLYALGAALSVSALALLLLVPVGSTRQPAVSAPVSRPAAPPPSLEGFADLDDFGVVSHATRAPAAEAAAGSDEGQARPKAPASKFPSPKPLVGKVVPPKPLVDLKIMAQLCGDLARVGDTGALPELLSRAAGILDASGIVVWIADPDGHELTPILVQGYSPQVATRLGTLKRDAENATASAFRTGLLQTVKADTISNGAIAAPLVSSGGCVGVMAAEVKNGGEQQEPLLAAATIIASQLATLVGPPAARPKAEAAS
jgi:CHASE3 domain sensor protein